MINNKYTIFYKTESQLVKQFCEEFEYELYSKPTLSQNWGFGKDIVYPDIYFHSGIVKESDIQLLIKSKIIIVNSNTIKHDIVEKSNGSITNDKIHVIYPTHNIDKFKKKEYKKAFFNRYHVDKKTKLVYFTGKNYEKTGLVQFLKFIKELTAANFKAVISGTPEQLKIVVPLLKELELSDKVILAQGDIFRAADIFVLPTSNKLFASNILKAMASKSVVFAPSSNHAFEIMDNFSIMDSFDDMTTVHKINMLLENTEELKKIQKENCKKVKEYTQSKQFKKLKLALDI
ncbi:MAG: glycosyltransferase [Campylobacteraceae bacterium]|nr:glycosyltransferase [Campylobacteraceae bacterium]